MITVCPVHILCSTLLLLSLSICLTKTSLGLLAFPDQLLPIESPKTPSNLSLRFLFLFLISRFSSLLVAPFSVSFSFGLFKVSLSLFLRQQQLQVHLSAHCPAWTGQQNPKLDHHLVPLFFFLYRHYDRHCGRFSVSNGLQGLL